MFGLIHKLFFKKMSGLGASSGDFPNTFHWSHKYYPTDLRRLFTARTHTLHLLALLCN